VVVEEAGVGNNRAEHQALQHQLQGKMAKETRQSRVGSSGGSGTGTDDNAGTVAVPPQMARDRQGQQPQLIKLSEPGVMLVMVLLLLLLKQLRLVLQELVLVGPET
jgi:hypothetical protein